MGFKKENGRVQMWPDIYGGLEKGVIRKYIKILLQKSRPK